MRLSLGLIWKSSRSYWSCLDEIIKLNKVVKILLIFNLHFHTYKTFRLNMYRRRDEGTHCVFEGDVRILRIRTEDCETGKTVTKISCH